MYEGIIALDCAWADARLLQIASLPTELRSNILSASNSKYLNALSEGLIVPGFTDKVFTLYQDLVPELVARWKHSDDITRQVAELCSLARILPFAPYLRSQAVNSAESLAPFLKVGSEIYTSYESTLNELLLASFRLLSYDRDAFPGLEKPAFYTSLFSHPSLPTRYLATQCFCAVMHRADAFSEILLLKVVGNATISGLWEGQQIDYRWLRLYEERRWKTLEQDLSAAKDLHTDDVPASRKVLKLADLSPSTACIGDTLIPRDASLETNKTTFVSTSTAQTNLRHLGTALIEQKPVLVMGAAGAGKTSLISEAARSLNKLSSMITLYLNEQTDAKSLLGLYVSSEDGASFQWQPGVLTKAMQQGRWVLIEDIDRAPEEVLGVLRPVLENEVLSLPSRREKIRPKSGFRIIATIRGSVGKTTTARRGWLTNDRIWNVVDVEPLTTGEDSELLTKRFPLLAPLLDAILDAHHQVMNMYADHPTLRRTQSRLPSLRDVIKWCCRVDKRARQQQLLLANQPVPESFMFDTFLDGVDCYAAHLSSRNLFETLVSSFGRALNIPSVQIQHLVYDNVPLIEDGKTRLRAGRTVLQKDARARLSQNNPQGPFAFTNPSKRTIQSIAAALACSEPLLLVGETGIGKTTAVQQLARIMGQRLTVINLSQQSEATDLVGGLKPITTRSLINPLREQFDALFEDTFSAKRNEKFQRAIDQAFKKQNWSHLLRLWQEGVTQAEALFSHASSGVADGDTLRSAKRRKLVDKQQSLKPRWQVFHDKVQQLQGHVEAGSDRNHVFSFVEGRLVQAVRNGEWVLLDEINLASSDTLDHIVPLFQNDEYARPSITLSEAGQVERVSAHPEFRVFAAMNPATDTGKKDLAPALRSLFTELYVEPGDQNVQDLIAIVSTYLQGVPGFEVHSAKSLAEAYLAVKKLNDEQRLTDGAGSLPHFSIRSLVRCLLYAKQHHAIYGLTRALYEGFAMSFFTVLSRESEMLVLPVVQSHLLSRVKNSKSFLAQQPKLSDEQNFIPFRHHFVQKGPESRDLQPDYIITPSVERNLINLARASSMRRFPILLQGPTSAGKTSMVEHLAKVSGNRYVRINNHEHTDLQEYLGSYASRPDGKLEYRDGVLVEALRKGHWVVLDELNLAPSDVLEALNRLLDDNRELFIPETQEVVRPHPSFMLFATQNPAGLYGGRKRLSRAFRNRFLEIHFDDIPENELEVILQERARFPQSFCTQIVTVYKTLSLQRQSSRLFEQRNSFATLRDLFRWAGRKADSREQLAYDGFMLLGERVRDPLERQIVKSTIEETMKVKIDEDVLYGLDKVPFDDQSIVWTKAMRRLYVLVSEALSKNEPILLVGETGCGKTQICQTVAHAFNKTLNIYNAHTNTETGDLIGSQRPVRQRAELAATLLKDFKVLASVGLFDVMEGVSVDQLVERFESMDASAVDAELVSNIRKSIGEYRALFAWNDGSVVEAMKHGNHFLLDEISLADDSVLERLNSLLEPSRTIVLAEKGSVDNLVIAQNGFQFLSTMNPGGDYGKRELSAALRNRLTEIWVPPLADDHDILPILRSKLGDVNGVQVEAMLKFAKWFSNRFQSLEDSATSLRSLLAWAEFIVQNAHLSPQLSFVHGAAMVYIDSLGADPARMTMSGAYDVRAIRMECLNSLQSLLQLDVSTIYHEVPKLELTHGDLVIGPFSLSRSPKRSETGPSLVFDAPTTAMNTMRIVRALQMNRPILLEGSPGVGKTATVTALASMLGKTFTRINLSDQTDLMDLFGADAPAEDESLGRFSWRDGPMLQAMQTGGWVLLDEMNLASQSVLEGLNSCLDHRHEVFIAELGRSFICHPDFTLFAAQNPHSQGGGRKGLPKSFVNRFTVVYADPFTEEDLVRICSRKYAHFTDEQISSVVANVAKLATIFADSGVFAQGGPWELNLRDVERWFAHAARLPTLPIHYPLDTLVEQRLRTEAQRTVARQTLGISEDATTKSLYNNLSSDALQVGFAVLQRDQVFQHSVGTRETVAVEHLAQAQAVMTAIQQKWPVILVGPSGSGKTRLLRSLARLSGANLEEVSLSADTDTMDLLGGFEQYDPARDMLEARTFCLDMVQAEILHMVDTANSSPENVSRAIGVYEQLLSHPQDLATLEYALSAFSSAGYSNQQWKEKLLELRKTSQKSSPRFVWNDGILVEAVQKGYWLILDNANLCNPSVLDRLNSLLEPDAHLVISEQHNSLEDARTIRPHPNFRIFLTVDPKYGELSRAMRNRSLEIFMFGGSSGTKPSRALSYPESSAIYRARRGLGQGQVVDADPTSTTCTEYMPIVQSLSTGDVNRGLLPVMSTFGTYENSLPAAEAVQSLSTNFYEDLVQGTTSTRSHLAAQPLVPLVNEPLLATNPGSDREALTLMRFFQLHVQVGLLQRLASGFQPHSHTSPNKQVSKVTTSLEKALRRVFQQDQAFWTNPAGFFFQDLMLVVVFLRDFFQFLLTESFNFELIPVYLKIARNILAKLQTSEVSSVVDSFSQELSVDFTLTTGKSLQRMWESWKPVTATSLLQLRNQLRWEHLLAKFDQLSLSLARPVAEIATVRLQLAQACARSLDDQGSSENFEALSRAVDDIGGGGQQLTQEVGHLAPIFSQLISKLILSPHDIEGQRVQRLAILARRPLPILQTTSTNHISKTLEAVATCYNYQCATASKVEAERSGLLQQLCRVTEQPLGALEYAQEELGYLATELCSQPSQLFHNQAENMQRAVKSLLAGIFFTHQDLFHIEDLTALRDPESIDLRTWAKTYKIETEVSEDDMYFQDVWDHYIHPAIQMLASENSRTPTNAGLALSLVCMAALTLMVPDRLFDPALFPTVNAERHQKRVQETQEHLSAQKRFQLQFTGQDTSMLIRLVEQDIADLGEAPTVPQVVRPEKSSLAKIQEEFSNIVRIILINKQADTLATLGQDYGSSIEENLSNFAQLLPVVDRLVRRLESLDRCYDDIVKPIQCLLKGLALGTLFMIDAVDADNRRTSLRSEVFPCPLLSSRSKTATASPRNSMPGYNDDLGFLAQLAAERSVCSNSNKLSSTVNLAAVLNVTDSFYEQWKTNLDKEQAQAESKSRYYAYRGVDDEEADVDQAELSAMFPSFDEPEDADEQADMDHDAVERSKPAIGYDPRTTAIRLARAHSALFGDRHGDFSLRQHILELLSRASSRRDGHDQGILPPEDLMAGTILLMEEQMQSLTADAKQNHSLNIYTDADVIESQKLVKLVRHTQTRFDQINARWPEHAVPIEVQQVCNELLSFKLNDPLIKLLTKAEKLHEVVAQWQSVASSEWSAASVLDELISLIVSWRRLELSSWSRLLDLESRKYEENGLSWYFIAYEAVIHNSCRIIEQSGDMERYCQDLTKTLDEFLRAASIGEYSTRLTLVEMLKNTLKAMVVDDTRLRSVFSCVFLTLQHHRRYEPAISKTLETGRKDLEKALKEVILLASWKDTSISALRDSARRSHHKLFKTVRKYRSLLSQPINSLSTQDLYVPDSTQEPFPLLAPSLDNKAIEIAAEQCMTAVPGWSTKPDRLRNTTKAAMSMSRIYESKPDFDIQALLSGMRADLVTSIKELRDQTPSTLTDDNTSLVRHLRERKRRLLADTIKSVTQMGIRRNLATSELARQATTTTVLATLSDYGVVETSSVSSFDDGAFHDLLDQMPQVRQALMKQSEDLTVGEVRRCVGLLEGFLFVTINQRQHLTSTGQTLHELSTALDEVRTLSIVEPSIIKHAPASFGSTTKDICRRLVWLPYILQTSSQILSFQGKQSGLDVSGMVAQFEHFTVLSRNLNDKLNGTLKVPPGLCSTNEMQSIEDAQNLLSQLATVLQAWELQNPNVEYLTRHIRVWTTFADQAPPAVNGKVHESLQDVDTAFQNVADKIFVAMQRFGVADVNSASSIEKPRWFTNAITQLSQCSTILHPTTIAVSLQQAVSKLVHLDPENLHTAMSLVIVYFPIFEQFFLIVRHLHELQTAIYHETCKFALTLSKSVNELATQGFCSPLEAARGEGQAGQLESGTGLGEGEGAEDISKDVGDDEDLSELAGAPDGAKQDGEMEASKDAVDMADEELKGQDGDAGEAGSGDEGEDQSEDEEQEVDEEAGSVDDLDPSAVDEKMWDDMKEEAEKELKGNKEKGKKSEEQTAAEGGQDMDGDDLEAQEEMDEEEDEGDTGAKPEAENVDSHVQEEKALELPEELQLNGDEEAKDGDVSDDGMDDLSDMDKPDDSVPQDQSRDDAEVTDQEMEEQKANDVQDDVEGDSHDEEENADGDVADEDEIAEDQPVDKDNDESRANREDEMAHEIDQDAGGEAGAANAMQDVGDQKQQMQGQNETEQASIDQPPANPGAPENQADGETVTGTVEQGVGRSGDQQKQSHDALKKLADVLEQYHQPREIYSASEEHVREQTDVDVDMADADFEDTAGDDQGDAQALGAAGPDQQQNLDPSKAIEDDKMPFDEDVNLPDVDETEVEQPESIVDRMSRLRAGEPSDRKAGQTAIIAEQDKHQHTNEGEDGDAREDSDIVEDKHRTEQDMLPPLTNPADATRLWAECSNHVHQLSLILTEQLRLILSPTTATKLRGDFRTGKRLNLKRIIPYIASGYKRDKIWMRRSIPSKRNYQIMLAVDDSKSMSEGGADIVACNTLAMLCKSLSMLEAGDLCVVGFGKEEHIRVAHRFGSPFSTESGTQILQNFSFAQEGTDVRKLIKESIAIFQDARLKATSSQADLWQLMLIISDGQCSDHEDIRRLVRRAMEEKIMIVFVIVDSVNAAEGKGSSILEMKHAVMERATDGKIVPKLKRYLEGFPFQYYVVVRDVGDLPAVLATALKGWFASVVDV